MVADGVLLVGRVGLVGMGLSRGARLAPTWERLLEMECDGGRRGVEISPLQSK
jgi:hypothetical protein